MDFSLSEEQNLLRESARRWVRDNYPFERRRLLLREHGGFIPGHWSQMAGLGWLALPFAEADGGLGGTPVDVAVLMEEFGRGLVLEPYLATILLAGCTIARAGDAAQRERYLPGLLDGSRHAALACSEVRYALDDVSCRAVRDGAGWRLDGRKIAVLNGDAADLLVVTARTGGAQRAREGIGLFVVDARAAGVVRRSWTGFDGFRAAEITFSGVQADTVLGDPAAGLALLEPVIDEATVALGAEAVGIMDVLYQATVEYSRTRRQFGVPVGSFQVLQHRMVDMFIHAEQARSLLLMAALKVRDPDPQERRRAASALKAGIGRAGRYVGQQAVQLHGGMGMTDELAIGHGFKRLTAIDLLLGNEDFHLRRLADIA